ncbi:MAG: helix-turn-helix domain-containing protein [Saprospiraceae bacterium]|nr:helix-turn-helix domain-containing protein [Saprospiraceae bacterium]
MLTARAERDDRLKALRIGVDDYLTKPFDEEELQVRIANLLLNFRSRQAVLDEMPMVDLPAPAKEKEAEGLAISEADRDWLESFEAFVQKNISNEMLAIPFLANEFTMSESTLLRQLKRLTGLSPVQYLQEVRLDKARYFLENRSYDSIAKIASKVGYGDVRNFSRSFKQRFGKSPSDFISN